MSELGGQATLCLRGCRRSARPTVRCMILLDRSYVHASLMRVPIRSFREANSARGRTHTAKYSGVYQYVISSSTEPRAQAVSTAAAVQTSGILSFRETVPLYLLILVYQHVISNTEPRPQAVSTAAAVQTSEMFGVLAVFDALHSLILHDKSSRSEILVLRILLVHVL